MKQVLEYDFCTGCGACLNVCPKKAISPHLDNEGFEMPFINQDICIDCGLCRKTCPVIHFDEINEIIQTSNHHFLHSIIMSHILSTCSFVNSE